MTGVALPRPRTLPAGRAGMAVWALAAVLGQASGVGPPVQPLLVLPFALVAPGLAATGLLRLGDRLTRLVLAVVMSTLVATVVAQALLALGRWSPTVWLVTLAVLTTVLAWLPGPRPRPTPEVQS